MSFALITGASKGIGKAFAEELAVRKKDLLLVARSEQQLAQLKNELEQKFHIKVNYISMDLSVADASRNVFEWCQQNGYTVDTLINNAGYGLSGPFEKHPLDNHLNMMQLNMNTVVELTYLFLPMLKSQNRSHILNVASSAAYQAVPFLSVYAASKTFVLQFSRGLHQELNGTNVSVTCVSPGATDTAFVERAQIGQKGLDMAKKVNMKPADVARIGIDAMYQGKAEVITGILNKIGAAMAWLLPKGFIEKTSAKIYQ
jgi:short-subunit dehydrogenase